MKYRASDPSCKWSQACCAAHGGGIRACARACPGAGEECGPLLPPGARGEKSLTGAVAGGRRRRRGAGRRRPLRRPARDAPHLLAGVRAGQCGRSTGRAGSLGGWRRAARRARWRRCDGPGSGCGTAVASSSAGSTDGGHSGLGHISSGTMGECAAPLARVGLRPARFAHNPRNPIAPTNAPPPLTTTVRGPRR